MPTFLRSTPHKYSKLGRGRKKKQVWRKPTGRDNKLREKRKGKPAMVSIGYSTKKKDRDKIGKKTPILVVNVPQIEKMQKDQIAIIGKVGKKKKIEIVKKAKELKVEIYRLNPAKFLKANSKQTEVNKKEIKKWIWEQKNN